MQLFRCHNLKSWSIRPRHGRNQRRPGVTGEGRRGWALITDGLRSPREKFSLQQETPLSNCKNAMVSNLNARSIRFLSQFSADCSDPNCSGHGACVSGKCYCKAGWQGERCNQVDQQVYQCLPGCSDHGTYDLETAACVCEEHWTGVDCSQPSCGLDCGLHGSCEQGRCKSVYTYDAYMYVVLCISSSFMGPPWACCDRDFGIGLPVGAPTNSRSLRD